jgi:hypothetical protein
VNRVDLKRAEGVVGEERERRRDVSSLRCETGRGLEVPFVLLLFPFKTAYMHAYT